MAITHETFTLKKIIAAPPARVFAAWADPEQKRKWFVEDDSENWETLDYTMDFRVGGREYGRFVLLAKTPAEGEHVNETVFLDIAPDQRIVFAYTMALNGRIHSASLATVRFTEAGTGTRVSYTEQGAFYDKGDGVAGRKAGWTSILNALAAYLVTEAA